MKKLFLLLILFIPLSLNAQRFQGGLMIGMNVSQIDGDNWSGYNKAGLVGGAYVFTEFKDRWGAQLEIRYSAKGSASPKNYVPKIKFRLQYIEIPLLAKFEVIENLDLQAGISFGYLFSAARDDGDGYVKFEEVPNRMETALCVGINYSFFDRFDLNVRYSYSVFPIFSKYTGSTYGTGAWFNNVIIFGFYIRIG
ncbi:hypothetical protein ES705_21268 [subsurface metagenome]